MSLACNLKRKTPMRDHVIAFMDSIYTLSFEWKSRMVFAIVQSVPPREDSTNQSCKSYKGVSFNSVLLRVLGLNNLLLRAATTTQQEKCSIYCRHWGNVSLLLWFRGTKLSSDTRWYWITTEVKHFQHFPDKSFLSCSHIVTVFGTWFHWRLWT